MKTEDFFNALKANGVEYFCGVPDSLLKDLCACINDNVDKNKHTITANEGNAIAQASGNYLATGKPSVVYMQNSGIGNCINPLLSLTDKEVYNIPILLLIGWRGKPGEKDEPQHIKQGKITDKLLDVVGIEYKILPNEFDKAKILLEEAFKYMRETNCSYAFLIQKGTFDKYIWQNSKVDISNFSREDAIQIVIENLDSNDIIVSTTGQISREVYEIREKLRQTHKQDFLTVGSMGHASSIALGIAQEKHNKKIYCFDGDGSFLMHQGSCIVNASKDFKNFKHIVFNNEAHDSVGGQETAIKNAKLSEIAFYSGYKTTYSVKTKEELLKILPEFMQIAGPTFLEIKVKCGARENLGRPKEKPIINKKIFMENLND